MRAASSRTWWIGKQVGRMVDEVTERFGGIDILVNNAGMVSVSMERSASHEFIDLEDADWDRDLAMNLGTAYNVTKRVLPGMVERGWGRVVMVSSVTGPLVTYAGLAGYAAAKAGMDGLMRAVALEVASRGVTVNSVQPGFVATGSQTPGRARGRQAHADRAIRDRGGDRRGRRVPRVGPCELRDGSDVRRRRGERDPGGEGPVGPDLAWITLAGVARRSSRSPCSWRRPASPSGSGSWRGSRSGERTTPRSSASGRADPLLITTGVGRGTVDVYTPVRASGEFDPAHEVLVFGRSLEGEPGHLVVTPLVFDDGTAALVIRGWVPFDHQTAPVADAEPPTGELTIHGFLVPDEGDGSATPDEHGVIARLDVQGIRSSLPYPVLPLPIQLTQQAQPQASDLPVPIPPEVLSEGPHLSYAIQWFTFATIAVVGAVILLRRERREMTS